MRFDDVLETVLAADLEDPRAVESAWRQLVDLIGRRRVKPDARALKLLDSLRDRVPLSIRAASARPLEYANPPLELVWRFVADDNSVAVPVLRTVVLESDNWIALLPKLSPVGRSILRNRRDMPDTVKRALEAYGPIDFVLPDQRDPAEVAAAFAQMQMDAVPVVEAAIAPQADEQTVRTALSPEDLVAQLLADEDGLPATAAGACVDAPSEERAFEIAEVVERIESFWREREVAPPPLPKPADQFRFETDAHGIFRWVEGISRAPIVGLTLDVGSAARTPDDSGVDGAAGGAFRRRAPFTNARLFVQGESDAGGDWRISAVPAFDPASGRFVGYRGTGRRPRADERAQPARSAGGSLAPDSLRQLVHELRTPTNAIAGFSEMIESQILGPVNDIYRDRAGEIRAQASELLGAIDDLDLAARIDSASLALVPGHVPLAPIIGLITQDLAPLAAMRGSTLQLSQEDVAVQGDRRAVERLLSRLLATLVSASGSGETVGLSFVRDEAGSLSIQMDRPKALADYPGESVLGIDDEREDNALLGTGFALRLARNLARELGGSLHIGPDRLTLRLPASDDGDVSQAFQN